MVNQFAKGLSAMLLRQYASITPLLGRSITLTSKAFDDGVLNVVKAVALFASYSRSAKFFKDTVGLNEKYTMVGAISVSVCFAAACSFQFENVMRHIQKIRPCGEGKYPYTDLNDFVYKVFRAIYNLLVKLFIIILVGFVYGGLFCMVLYMKHPPEPSAPVICVPC